MNDAAYERKIDPFLAKHESLNYAKVLIMSRYGMLDCANNYAIKYGGKLCKSCNETDDENHRINFCKKWEKLNFCRNQRKVNFQNIYSHDENDCLEIVKVVASLWDLESGKNEMRVSES